MRWWARRAHWEGGGNVLPASAEERRDLSACEGRWGPVGEDLVGVASARLLALGVARGARLDALRLLGLLTDHTDADGRVRITLQALAGEFDLSVADVHRSLAALLAVEVIVDAGGGFTVAGREPDADGLRLAGFLDNVAVVLEGASPVEAVTDRAPSEPAGSSPPAPLVPLEPAGPERRVWSVVVSALATAAALLAFVLSPVRDTGSVITAAPPMSSTTTPPAPALSDVGEPGGTAPTPTAPPRGEDAPAVSPQRPAGRAAGAPLVCPPVLAPRLVVSSIELRAVPGDGLLVIPALVDQWALQVSGDVTNPSAHGVNVDPFLVTARLGDQTLSTTTSVSASLAAGGTATWSVRLPVQEPALLSSLLGSEPSLSAALATLLPLDVGAGAATLRTWSWADPALAEGCPAGVAAG